MMMTMYTSMELVLLTLIAFDCDDWVAGSDFLTRVVASRVLVKPG